MRKPRIGAALLLAAAGLACSSTPPPQAAWDHAADFSKWKTFDWHAEPDEEKPVGGAIVDARFVDEHVKKAITDDLAKKGFRPASGGPADFHVDYHTRAAGIVERDRYGQYTWWSPYTYVGSQYYKENVLAIDLRDREKKLVWRGWVTRITGSNPEAVARDIQKAVSQILASFPPGAAPKA